MDKDIKVGDLSEVVAVGNDYRRVASRSGSAESKVSTGANAWLKWLVLLVAVGAGFGYMQSQIALLNRALLTSELERKEADQLIGDLQADLSETDKSSTTSGEVVGQKLVSIADQLKALTLLSHKNKKLIATNKANLANARKNTKALMSQAKIVDTQQDEMDDIQLQQTKQLAQMDTRLSLLADVNAQHDTLLDSNSSQLTRLLKSEGSIQLRRDLEKIQLALKSIKSTYGNRIIDNEEAIAAIDLHRKQVNAELDRLSGELRGR